MSTYNQPHQKTLQRWIKHCDASGWAREAQAVKLGLSIIAYRSMITDQHDFPQDKIEKMIRIMDGRELLDRTVLHTSLLNEMEKYIQRCKNEKMMAALAATTGQGKTVAAKYLANQYNCKYMNILTDQMKQKVAAKKNFISALCQLFFLGGKNVNGLRHLIDHLQRDTRIVLIIDEAQRLISEDWGYFEVLQDLLDNVPTLSILMVGNYRFYNDMFTDGDVTYSGVTDLEQFKRRITTVKELPRMQKADVKLWSDYNNINLKPSELQTVTEFFSARAGLSDLENVRQEIVRIMGRGGIKDWEDVYADTLITIYRGNHTKTKETKNAIEEGSKDSKAHAA